MSKIIYYRVWNKGRTHCYETTDKQLAYEVRKGAESNCYNEEGYPCRYAYWYCENISGEEDCITEEYEHCDEVPPPRPKGYHNLTLKGVKNVNASGRIYTDSITT